MCMWACGRSGLHDLCECSVILSLRLKIAGNYILNHYPEQLPCGDKYICLVHWTRGFGTKDLPHLSSCLIVRCQSPHNHNLSIKHTITNERTLRSQQHYQLKYPLNLFTFFSSNYNRITNELYFYVIFYTFSVHKRRPLKRLIGK